METERSDSRGVHWEGELYEVEREREGERGREGERERERGSEGERGSEKEREGERGREKEREGVSWEAAVGLKNNYPLNRWVKLNSPSLLPSLPPFLLPPSPPPFLPLYIHVGWSH